MDMPLHNAQISFLPLVIPRRQGAGIPLCRHDLQGWIPGTSAVMSAVNLIPNSLNPEDSCLTLYGSERQLG